MGECGEGRLEGHGGPTQDDLGDEPLEGCAGLGGMERGGLCDGRLEVGHQGASGARLELVNKHCRVQLQVRQCCSEYPPQRRRPERPSRGRTPSPGQRTPRRQPQNGYWLRKLQNLKVRMGHLTQTHQGSMARRMRGGLPLPPQVRRTKGRGGRRTGTAG